MEQVLECLKVFPLVCVYFKREELWDRCSVMLNGVACSFGD